MRKVLPVAVLLLAAACEPAAGPAVPAPAAPVTIELYMPGSVIAPVQVQVRAGDRLLGTLGPGTRMVCRLAPPAMLETVEAPGLILGTRLLVEGGPALVRVGLAVTSVAVGTEAASLQYVARLEPAATADRETFSADRADAWREVPCAS